MGYKYNQKSVRFSDEVLSYINSYKGDNFNNKLENIVLFVCKNENDLLRRLDFLNEEIDVKRNELEDIKNKILDLKDVDNKLNGLIKSVDIYVEGVGSK